MYLLFRIRSFLNYLVKRKNKYSIHSPFVFGFVTVVLQDKSKYEAYRTIDHLLKQAFDDKRKITTVDYGAITHENRQSTYPIAIGKLAKKRSNKRWVYKLLFRIVQHYKPAQVIELGTSVGFSSVAMALANPGGQLITLEGCSQVASVAKAYFKKLSLTNITTLVGNFDVTLQQALDKSKQADLIFFDGNHRSEPTLAYFNQCLSKAHEESVFVFDDIHWSAGMESAWNTIRNHPNVSVSLDLYQVGLVFFRKGISKQHFILKV